MAPHAGGSPRRGSLAIGRIRATLGAQKARMSSEAMDDKPENVQVPPDLAAAIQLARAENAERAEAVADLRELEIGRLRALKSALKPVIDQAPQDVDLFDLALAPGERPRLFIDMIAFVDMGRDKRAYRFFQDTRHGRVLIAESQSADVIAVAVADYVARRLVERERALAAEWRFAGASQPQPPSEANGRRGSESESADAIPAAVADYVARRLVERESGPAADRRAAGAPQPEANAAASPIAKARALAWPPTAGESESIAAGGDESKAPPKRRFAKRLGDAFSRFLMLLGSIALALLIGVGVDWAWAAGLRDLWTHWIGAPPF
jgi:hypothetical protein